jgi:integrase
MKVSKAIHSYQEYHNTIDFEIQNPCDTPILKKVFRASRPEQWKIIEKDSRESEIVYIPRKITDRLREYIQDKGIEPEQRIFPIAYNAARVMFKKAGELAGVNLRPHDLRRRAATHARRLNLHWPLCKPA